MTHNSSANFRLIHFLLWTKGFHQSPNFGTFACSGENLLNFSCHFSNQKSVFLQIFYHSSVSWKITPLYFFSANIIYFGHKEPRKTIFVDIWVLRSKFIKFLMSILKWQVNSPSIFVSFFIVTIHNSSVDFKVIHFLLWAKGSHQSPNFDTFECSGENLSNSSCHFQTSNQFFFKFCITLQCLEK